MTSEAELLDRIKRLAVIAMFSDDEFLDQLVLKGGNAMDLIHRLSTRASVDLDFSMQHDFPEGLDAFRARVERALRRTFQLENLEVFDAKLEERPREMLDGPMAEFWGGYGVEFKLIDTQLHAKFANNVDDLRKHCLTIGKGKKFLIDISRFEFVSGKQEAELEGHRIYVYSPEMIVCEKLRAICQQMPEYGPIIRRDRPGGPRARDFVDIHVLVTATKLDITSTENKLTLQEMFKAKKVPLHFLTLIEKYRDFHRTDFAAVVDTVKPGVDLLDFDTYFDFILGLVKSLEAFWDE